jgi:hypothetical protein
VIRYPSRHNGNYISLKATIREEEEEEEEKKRRGDVTPSLDEPFWLLPTL